MSDFRIPNSPLDMRDQIKKLQSDLALAREGLEFYNAKENWVDNIMTNDDDWEREGICYPGGKKAREILTQLDKKDGE